MTMLARLSPYLVCLVVGAMVGGLSVDRCSRGPVVVPVAAPEVRTAPNDVVLEVKPGASPSMPAPSKPRGGKVVSTTEVTVAGGIPVRVNAPISAPKSAQVLPVGNASRVSEQGTNEPEPESVVKECLTAEDFECPAIPLRIDILSLDDGQQYAAVIAPDGNEVTGVHIPHIAGALAMKNRVGAFAGDGTYVFTYTREWGRRISLGVAATVIDGRVTPGIGGEWRY